MLCPKCQFENEDGSYRCTNCLALLDLPEHYQGSTSSGTPSALGIDQMPTSVLSGPADTDSAPAANAWTSPSSDVSGAEPILDSLVPKAFYRPSGKSSPTTALRMFVLGIAASIIVGAIYYFVTKFMDLVILMPILFGVFTGAVLARIADKGKCRNLPVAVTIAVVAGLLTYGTRLAVDAYTLRTDMVEGVSQQLEDDYGLSRADAVKAAEKLLTPVETVKLYFRASADSGISIGDIGSHSHGTPITGIGYYVLLALDVILLTGSTIALTVSTVKRPFCESCEGWVTPRGILLKSPKQANAVVALVQAQDWNGAYKLPVGGVVDQKNHCNVFINKCKTCADSHVWVTSTSNSFERGKFYASLNPEIAQRLIDGQGKLTSLAAPATIENAAT